MKKNQENSLVSELVSLTSENKKRIAFNEQAYPHFIKYMGSKSKIMGFVLEGINEVYDGGVICDLFSGSASLAGAIGKQVNFQSNDIQAYSGVIASTYLNSFLYEGMPSAENILDQAQNIFEKNKSSLGMDIDYSSAITLSKFKKLEKLQQGLIQADFDRNWHLFAKYYSGTWWSAEQCLWIDAIREVSESYKTTPSYFLLLSSLMYAMAYTSQGTGHFAQYRDANTESGMKDISIYRNRSLRPYFSKKYNEVVKSLSALKAGHSFKVTTEDFKACLENFEGGTVYADPPYCIVHYSRFYHALETLVLYDYPAIQEKAGCVVKGRYRVNRHQSPFCIKTKVEQAFSDLFEGVRKSRSNLVLSYSNTGMISLEELERLVKRSLPNKAISLLTTDHKHMTLGRKFDRDRDVTECLVLVR